MRTNPLAPPFRPVLTTLLGLLGGPVPATELPPPLPAKAVGGVESDGLLLKKVNAALAADKNLAAVPLVVSVVDRVAVVGGPVPDAALIPRVTAALKAVAGLEAVKVSCWPMGGPDPFADRVADRMKAVPPAVAANPPAPPLAPVGPRITVAPASAPPAPPVVAAKPADDAPRTAAKVAMTGPNPAGGFLQDPVAVVRRPNGEKRVATPGLGYQPIAPPAVPARPVSDVKPTADKVESVKAGDPRFARLSVRVADGTAVVSGKPAEATAAWAFAEALRTVPGVTRVIVRSAQ